MLAMGIADNPRLHQRLWCCDTMVQINSGCATASARLRASESNERPPRSEQNCLGTATPNAVFVNPWSRLPSPPANTIAQVFPEVVILFRSVTILMGMAAGCFAAASDVSRLPLWLDRGPDCR